MSTRAPSYKGLRSSSAKATAAAKGSSKKTDTKPEVRLRRALWAAGLRYRKNVTKLPGKPDVAFIGKKVAVFCDGDFWHGKDWEVRKAKLATGSNPGYWVAKIERNMQRDRENTEKLVGLGWTVLRFWESDIKRDVGGVVAVVQAALTA